MDGAKLISVIVPTYRRNDLLAKCLRCLKPGVQTLDPSRYEVIVSDDGPEDDNARAMVQSEFPWAIWTKGPGRGPAANRNHGASLAKGEWLAFTDDDCLPDPEWLYAFESSIREGIQVYEGKTVCRAGLNSPLVESPINEAGGYLWSCNMMVSLTTFNRMRGFDVSFPAPASEDVDFRLRLDQLRIEFLFVPIAIVDHPPRMIPSLTRQLVLEESIFFLNSKWGRQPSFLEDAKITMIAWGKKVIQRPKSFHSISALFYCLSCITLKAWHYPRWKRRYPTRIGAEIDNAANTV